MGENFLLGLSQLCTVAGLLVCLAGALLGTVVGILPGLSAGAMAALVLPLMPLMPLDLSLVLLSSMLYGAQYSGSLGAILLGVPGEASSTISVVEGHTLAKHGKAKQAIQASAVASFMAGLLSTAVLALLAAYAVDALKVSPFHQLMLVAGAAVLFVLVTRQSLWMSFLAAGLGFVLSLGVSGGPQRSAVVPLPGGGLELAAIAIALFGLAEAGRSLLHHSKTTDAPALAAAPSDEPLPLRRVLAPAARGGVLGLLGSIPGFTFTLLTTLAYVLESTLSKRKDFGKGSFEGLVAPEAANNSAAQGSLGAALLLGIPSGPVAAMMVGLLQKQGLQPGPSFVTESPVVVWTLLTSFLVVNVLLFALNFCCIAPMARLLQLSRRKLDVAIVVASLVGLALLSLESWVLFPLALLIAGAAVWLQARGVCRVTVFVGCVLGTLLQSAHLATLKRGYPGLSQVAHDPWLVLVVGCAVLGLLMRKAVQSTTNS